MYNTRQGLEKRFYSNLNHIICGHGGAVVEPLPPVQETMRDPGSNPGSCRPPVYPAVNEFLCREGSKGDVERN